MKYLSSFTLLVILIAAAPTYTFGGWGGGCLSDEDCYETECCLKQFGIVGQCLVRPQEDEICTPKPKHSRMFQQSMCPCAPGLECIINGNRKYPGMGFSKPPTCQPVAQAEESNESTEK
ncbi:uncharacterized protein LOC118197529 [Stegodyphus dumicola]|uniref:uncharacterized protein LOC118197529 n=1 Tax=Stegodyphus dumicola TaxID=202533 RepID=UPI0015B21023|nr:uncharacterized protein LOC118197529 [Stegodyphus dumicola]